MDQFKQFLAQAAKHQFWIIIGTAVLLSGLAWYLASSNLSKLYAEQEAVIKGKFGDMDRVSNSLRTHPNQDSQAEMQRIIASLSDDVQQAWEEQYQRQAEYLRWPDTIGLPRLIAKLKSYYPVELKLSFPDEPSDVVEGDKLSFSSYFDRQLPELAKIIGVEWTGQVVDTSSGTGTGLGLGSMGSGGFGSNDPAGSDSSATFGSGLAGTQPLGTPGARDVVRWPTSSQSELLNSIRLWQGNKPTVYEMIYTQENMWVLEGLFNIIAKTNIVPQTQRPATANVQAAIKEIEFIRIGAAAIGDAGDVTIPAQPGGASSLDEGMGFGGLSSDLAAGGSGGLNDYSSESASTGFSASLAGMEGLGTGAGGDSRPRDPADRRYVDRDFKPILGDDLRSRIASEDPADAYFAVAKRVPVRVRMTIDGLRIQEFLANCGNEGLMLEVRQVRLGNTAPASISGRSGFAAGAMSLGGGLGGGMGSTSQDSTDSGYASGDGLQSDFGSGMSMGGGSGGGPLRRSARIPRDIKVEVYGIVYLFYPVNIDRLGLSKVDENTELTETVEDTDIIPDAPQGREFGPADDQLMIEPDNLGSPEQATKEVMDQIMSTPQGRAEVMRLGNKDQALTQFQRANGVSDRIAEAAVKEWVLTHDGNGDWDLEEVKAICLRNKANGIPNKYLPESEK